MLRFVNCLLAVALLCTAPVAHGTTEEQSGLSVAGFHVADDQLQELIDRLLDLNPQLAAARGHARSEVAGAARAGGLPDLELRYRWFAKSPETRVGPQEHALEVSQRLPWGGKRDLESRGAETFARGKTLQIEVTERTLVAELKRAFFEAAYLQEARIANREERDLLRRIESIALKRYSTGKGIQQSVIKVQTELSRLLDRETELSRQLDRIENRIGYLTGHASLLRLDPISIELPAAALTSGSNPGESNEHPRLLVASQRIEANKLHAERRALDSKPDFRVGLGYTFVGDRDDPQGRLNPPPDNGEDILSVTLGVGIPLYRERVRAGVEEARGHQHAAESELLRVRDELRFEARDARVRLASLGDRGRLYRDVIVPQAEGSLASAEAAYSTNRLGFLDLVDAERTLFEARLTYHRLVSDAWIALADLELALGRAYPDPEIYGAAGGAQ
ncbi:MAG: TolC family protein [bacterium]|nr:TolC family protein [bacterium]